MILTALIPHKQTFHTMPCSFYSFSRPNLDLASRPSKFWAPEHRSFWHWQAAKAKRKRDLEQKGLIWLLGFQMHLRAFKVEPNTSFLIWRTARAPAVMKNKARLPPLPHRYLLLKEKPKKPSQHYQKKCRRKHLDYYFLHFQLCAYIYSLILLL